MFFRQKTATFHRFYPVRLPTTLDLEFP